MEMVCDLHHVNSASSVDVVKCRRHILKSEEPILESKPSQPRIEKQMSELVCCWKISRQHKWLGFRSIKVVPRAKEDGLLPSEGTSFFGNAMLMRKYNHVWTVCDVDVRVLETKGGEVWFHLFCPSVYQCRIILLDCSSFFSLYCQW